MFTTAYLSRIYVRNYSYICHKFVSKNHIHLKNPETFAYVANTSSHVTAQDFKHKSAPAPHMPVMPNEALEALQVRPNGVYLDMTFGGGGHSRKVLEKDYSTSIIAVDRDPIAYSYAQQLHEEFPNRVMPILGKFSDLPKLLGECGIADKSVDGVLMDLGPSSMQFDTPNRGFMLSKDGPLDMRMDGNRDPNVPTAADILEHIEENHLYKVLKYYGQQKNARQLARALVEARLTFTRLNTTKELADFIAAFVGDKVSLDKLGNYAHPATKTFQALRILVNDELNELDMGLRVSHFVLKKDRPLVVISFHSLEDTIVKRHFTGVDIDSSPSTIGTQACRKNINPMVIYGERDFLEMMRRPWKSIYKHVITPSDEEVAANRRCRSAKLRAAVKDHFNAY